MQRLEANGFFTVVEGNYGTLEGQRVGIVQGERILLLVWNDGNR